MATSITLKCRSKSAIHSIKDLNTHSTLFELKGFILSLTGLEYNELSLKSGYPPTCITNSDETLLTDCGIRNGDLIIVEELKGGSSFSPKKRPAATCISSSQTSIKKPTVNQVNPSVKRKIVPANNSCLFTSIGFCLHRRIDQADARIMRRIVAEEVLSDPEKFTEALLGRPPQEYAAWIMKPESWGGGIELSILCKQYSMEIDVIDIKNTRIEKFGEEHSNRILLLYDGIHYDALFEEDSPKPRTIFPSANDDILARALALAEKENANRQFTDTKNFKLKCLNCSRGLNGALDAKEHAELTGHVNFGET